MVRIAIETTDGFSISIDNDGDRYDYSATEEVNKTSELLWEQLSHVRNKKDIGEIYLSSGPGNYTNLRIVYSFAMGIKKATGAKIYTIPSFLAKAHSLLRDAPFEKPLLLVNYARNREFCYQVIADNEIESIDWQDIHLSDKAGIIDMASDYRLVTNSQSYGQLGFGEVINLEAGKLINVPDKYKVDNGLIYARASV